MKILPLCLLMLVLMSPLALAQDAPSPPNAPAPTPERFTEQYTEQAYAACRRDVGQVYMQLHMVQKDLLATQKERDVLKTRLAEGEKPSPSPTAIAPKERPK